MTAKRNMEVGWEEATKTIGDVHTDWIMTVVECPQQTNSLDCGMFMLMFAQCEMFDITKVYYFNNTITTTTTVTTTITAATCTITVGTTDTFFFNPHIGFTNNARKDGQTSCTHQVGVASGDVLRLFFRASRAKTGGR